MVLFRRLIYRKPPGRLLVGDTPSLLDETVPKITEGFITSRFNSLQAGYADDHSENPLDNIELLQEQLESFPYLCRFQYESSSLYIMNMMEPIMQAYTERARSKASGDTNELAVIEGQISWLVHIIAVILKVKQAIGGSMDSQELIDAELAARVLQLINVTDQGLHTQRYGEISKQRLDRAILTFFQNFRKSYVGDQAMHSSKLYSRLSELLGIRDHQMLLNFIIGKIATNHKFYTECEEVIEHTLSLFLELASGYMTGKLLLKLDSVNFIVANHTRENFPYLDDYKCSRSRTTFYYTLGYLIFMEDSPVKFKLFMEPLLQVTTPLLKFMSEFVLNKAQRMTFDTSSPNGILLFREVSKLIVAYGSRVLSSK